MTHIEAIGALVEQYVTDQVAAVQAVADDYQSQLADADAQVAGLQEQAAIDVATIAIDVATITDLQQQLTECQDSTDPDPDPPVLRFPGDPGEGNIYWGSTTGEMNVPQWVDFSAAAGGQGLCRLYYQSNQVSTFAADTAAVNGAGALMVASFKVPNNDWTAVANGSQDAWLQSVADATAALIMPTFVCLHHEPNGNGSPADFQAMYTHAAPILHSAPNLVLTPIYNGWLFVSGSGWQQWEIEEADVSGIDIYPRAMKNKAQLADKYNTGLGNLATFGKPMMLCEWGVRVPLQGEYATQLITDLDSILRERGDTVGAVYFNSPRNVNVHPEAGSYELKGAQLAAFQAVGALDTSVNYY